MSKVGDDDTKPARQAGLNFQAILSGVLIGALTGGAMMFLTTVISKPQENSITSTELRIELIALKAEVLRLRNFADDGYTATDANRDKDRFQQQINALEEKVDRLEIKFHAFEMKQRPDR